jgi:hypothetical protein
MTDVLPSVNGPVRADSIVYYTINSTVSGHKNKDGKVDWTAATFQVLLLAFGRKAT